MKKKAVLWIVIVILFFSLIAFCFYYERATRPFVGVDDVSARLESPDRGKTAILIRHYGFDQNFLLYIVDDFYDQPSRHSHDLIWSSRDYNPGDPSINLHEDLEWSKDASVIAVIVDQEYVFAYDFNFEKGYEDDGEIRQLLASRNRP